MKNAFVVERIDGSQSNSKREGFSTLTRLVAKYPVKESYHEIRRCLVAGNDFEDGTLRIFKIPFNHLKKQTKNEQ